MSRDEEARLLLLTMSVEDILNAAPSDDMETFWTMLSMCDLVSKEALTIRLPLLLAAPIQRRQVYVDEIFGYCLEHRVVLSDTTHKDLNAWGNFQLTFSYVRMWVFHAVATELAPSLQHDVADILLEFFDAFCENRPIRSHW